MSTTSDEAGRIEQALADLAQFPLLDALYGRRSRRFPLGGEIPDGVLAYRSAHDPVPLSELERLLVLTAMGGTTGWHYAIMRHERYAPLLSNYSGGAAGRTFPSAAGFHTVELFFTDDSGTYVFPTRDARRAGRPGDRGGDGGADDRASRRADPRLSDERIHLPGRDPTWRATTPGSPTTPARCW